jgi:hypothetical protein
MMLVRLQRMADIRITTDIHRTMLERIRQTLRLSTEFHTITAIEITAELLSLPTVIISLLTLPPSIHLSTPTLNCIAQTQKALSVLQESSDTELDMDILRLTEMLEQ